MEDFNIDILARYELKNVIEKSTRNGPNLIDHIITKITEKVPDQDALPFPTINDHDAPFITLNTKVARYESRYKIIKSYENSDMEYINDVSTLPFYKNLYSRRPK